MPAEHTWPAGQAMPHPPQLAASDWMSTQTPLQLVAPAWPVQAPAVQVCPGWHMVPQLPQLLTCVRSAHPFGQTDKPAGQVHTPPTQPAPATQTLPQLPQLFGSLAMSTQIPPHMV